MFFTGGAAGGAAPLALVQVHGLLGSFQPSASPEPPPLLPGVPRQARRCRGGGHSPHPERDLLHVRTFGCAETLSAWDPPPCWAAPATCPALLLPLPPRLPVSPVPAVLPAAARTGSTWEPPSAAWAGTRSSPRWGCTGEGGGRQGSRSGFRGGLGGGGGYGWGVCVGGGVGVGGGGCSLP